MKDKHGVGFASRDHASVYLSLPVQLSRSGREEIVAGDWIICYGEDDDGVKKL